MFQILDRVDIYLIRGKYYMRVKAPLLECCGKCHLVDEEYLPQCIIACGTLPTCVDWYYVEVHVDIPLNRVFFEDSKYSISNIIIPYKLSKNKKRKKKHLKVGDINPPWDKKRSDVGE